MRESKYLKISQSAILESMIRKTRLSMDTRCLIVRMLKAQKTVNKVNRSLSSLLEVRLTFTTHMQIVRVLIDQRITCLSLTMIIFKRCRDYQRNS